MNDIPESFWTPLNVVDNYGNDCWDSANLYAGSFIVSTNTYGGYNKRSSNEQDDDYIQDI